MKLLDLLYRCNDEEQKLKLTQDGKILFEGPLCKLPDRLNFELVYGFIIEDNTLVIDLWED